MFILPETTRGPSSVALKRKDRTASTVHSRAQSVDAFTDTASTAFSLPTDMHILDGFVDTGNETAMRQLYRDIYYHDPVCGTSVDIYSMLPFGDFSLSGVPDREMLSKFLETCEAISVKTLLPSMTIDQLVEGAATGGIYFNSKKKIFDTYLPLNLDFVDLYAHPIHGNPPLMDIKVSDEAKRIFNKKGDKRVEKLLKALPDVLQKLFTEGKKVELAPENSVYIPRSSRLSYKVEGISLYRRIVPIWLIEKALARGTIESAYRRQRGIMWVQMGDMDWVASPAEMKQMGADVVMADRDPLGAVLVTRPGVNFSEIRDAQSLWKHSDIIDIYNPIKLKAMGLNESLVNGDLTVGSADAVMTTFNRQLRTHRDNIVREFLYNKVFPYTAMANDFEKDDQYMETSSDYANAPDDRMDDVLREMASYNGKRIFKREGRYMALADGQLRDLDGKDPAKYYCPTVNWHDSLRPEVQADYLTTLDQLEQKGVPIPLRTLIAAAGMSVGDIVASMDEDVELRKVMFDHAKKIKKYLPAPPEEQGFGGGGGGGGYDGSALADALVDLGATASAERRGLMARAEHFEEMTDKYHRNVNNGPVLSAKGKRLIEERANKVTAEAAVNLAERENAKTREFGKHGRPLMRK
jgi:hypothetical protein